MLDFESVKPFFAAAGTVLVFLAYIPYLKDIFAGHTKPHAFTWLIWTLTTATAATGLWLGGGGWGAVSQTASASLTFLFFLLSLRYGTRNITKSDVVILVSALLAIGVWWFLDNPVLAVLMVTAIDTVGYLPTYRKSYAEPWSESLPTWWLFTLYAVFGFLAIREYNLLTAPYLFMTICANLLLVILMIIRRRSIPKPTLS